MGIAITALGVGKFSTWDEMNAIEVVLLSGELVSCSEIAVLNGANNAAILGNELIQFQKAELIGEQTYRLSRLLRGRQGTESFINTHQEGDRFILLSPALYSLNIPTDMIGKKVHYKAVTIGATIEEAEEQEFVIQANALKPFAPIHITGQRDKQGNLAISWIRRARYDNDWRDNVDVPLDEAQEKYLVEILDLDSDKIIRTLETSAPTVIYSAEQQGLDFKSIPKTITVRIYQYSTLIGKGYPAIVTI